MSAVEAVGDFNLRVELFERRNISPIKAPIVVYGENYRNTLDNVLDLYAAERAFKQNPNIRHIGEEYGIKFIFDGRNVKELKEPHLNPTNYYSSIIGNQMGLSVREKTVLKLSSFLHDLGKALIPRNILTKPGRLAPEEMRIVNLHANLGRELLKTRGSFSDDILTAVGGHHQKLDDPGGKPNLVTQILTASDIYTALRARRSYKPSMTQAQALKIMDSEVGQGKLNPQAVDCLRTIK